MKQLHMSRLILLLFSVIAAAGITGTLAATAADDSESLLTAPSGLGGSSNSSPIWISSFYSFYGLFAFIILSLVLLSVLAWQFLEKAKSEQV